MSDECTTTGAQADLLNLRIASVFIILVSSTSGAVFPIFARKSPRSRIPPIVFDFAKYFGSGVILATAFIHLLAPAFHELTSPCLSGVWTEYDWAPALAMVAVFALFFVELFVFRVGQAHGAGSYDPHGHGVGEHAAHSAHGPEVTSDHDHEHSPEKRSPRAQIIGVAILEFGVVFHSVLIGLTLAVDGAFKPLFVVIVFHQMFEGLGLGARLASLELPASYSWAPLGAAFAYGITTPLGIAIGLGVRSSYAPGSATASIVSGVFDAVSAGILLYTGLVELMAHEFLFSPHAMSMSNKRLGFACACMTLGAGIMALLGRWA